jgi:hypothetical protein
LGIFGFVCDFFAYSFFTLNQWMERVLCAEGNHVCESTHSILMSEAASAYPFPGAILFCVGLLQPGLHKLAGSPGVAAQV